ncbi:MAG TPA: hypothetical protein VGM05_13405 [Planctomycetaceae bacterium]|jgi:hypothetical protein
MANQTLPGGASTVGGIVYQMLWCLLRTLQVRVGTIQYVNYDPSSVSASLILEPAGGGGDARVIGDEVLIEQLKAKSDGGTWSLQSIVADILPDLFLASTSYRDRRVRYRFVTEGRMGDWQEVYGFFQRLNTRTPPSDVISAFNNRDPLRFRRASVETTGPRRKSFFPDESYTERSLFMRIADELQGRPAIKNLGLTQESLYRALWLMLGGFEFDGSQQRDQLQREIDSLLLALADNSDDIPQIRDALAMDLARRASSGNVRIEPAPFLAEHRLNAVPLTAWGQIRDGARRELGSALRRLGYDFNFDVRTIPAARAAMRWQNQQSVLVISGEPGQGKTWLLAAVARHLLDASAPVVWVEGKGDATANEQAAADSFWLDVRGGEGPLRLRQVADRLQRVVPGDGPVRLRALFDGIRTYPEAAALVRASWSEHGIAVAMSCSCEIAAMLYETFKSTVYVVDSDDFSLDELHDLLARRLGDAWTGIPEDVRETLRRPLLASIYCREMPQGDWRPTNEYELYEAAWRRVRLRGHLEFPLDSSRLELLASDVLAGAPYPWSGERLLARDIDDSCLQRLQVGGWIARTAEGRFRIFHDRLLNWTVAESLLSSLRTGNRTDEVLQLAANIARQGGQIGNVFLGYVPIDLLWLAAGDPAIAQLFVPRALAALEGAYRRPDEDLYEALIPTLGPRIASPLFERFREIEGPLWVVKALATALGRTAGERLDEFATGLLRDTDSRLQRRGIMLLNAVACPRALDLIWDIHVAAGLDPERFGEDRDKKWLLYDESFGALENAARAASEWVISKIESASRTDPVNDLGWLLAKLPEGAPAWERCKQPLFAKIPNDKLRVLATLIGQFRDSSELPWLRAHLNDHADLCGPAALRSLSRIDPDQAAMLICELDSVDLCMTRSWCFHEVYRRRPTQTHASFLAWMRRNSDPWSIGLVFRGRENDLLPEELDILLTDLNLRLEQLLSGPADRTRESLYSELDFLAKIHSPALLEVFDRFRSRELGNRLASYIRRLGPKRGRATDSLERDPGLSVLTRILGNGAAGVVTEFLQCDDQFGRFHATRWAFQVFDEDVAAALISVVHHDETWDGPYPLAQNEALHALALRECWEDVARGLERWGLNTSIDFTYQRLVPWDYNPPWIMKLRERLVDDQPTAGKVIAFALVGARDDAVILHRILETADHESELAHACIIGLEMLEDASDTGVRLVAPFVVTSRFKHSATKMLGRAGTDAAWAALLADLKKTFDHITALNLINLSCYADDVVDLVIRELPKNQRIDFWDLIHILLQNIQRVDLKQRILADPWLRNALHEMALAAEGRSWIVGSKAAALASLAECDPETAIQAIQRCMLTPECRDRERYPYLLVKIDRPRATAFLLDCVETESSWQVRFAIARALVESDVSSQIESRFMSIRPEARSAACFMASWMPLPCPFVANIQRCLDDLDGVVISAAIDALDRLHDRDLCTELIRRVERAEDFTEKWRFLNALVNTVDPGDEFCGWPNEIIQATHDMSPLVAKPINDRLKDRRAELTDRLKKRHSS